MSRIVVSMPNAPADTETPAQMKRLTKGPWYRYSPYEGSPNFPKQLKNGSEKAMANTTPLVQKGCKKSAANPCRNRIGRDMAKKIHLHRYSSL